MRRRVAPTSSWPMLLLVPLALGGCSGDEGTPGADSGGSSPAAGGGPATGGSLTGGAAAGGAPAGGTATGGSLTGGASTGGTLPGAGGSPTGGNAPGAGGSPTGGSSPGAGGVATGGSLPGAGGSPTGGSLPGTGGAPTGGTSPADGGAPAGGETPGGMGGDTTGGMGTAGEAPATGGEDGGGAVRWGEVEDPTADCTVGAMPSVGSLTANPKLPDPFTKMDGTRMTSKSEWACRREEILQEGFEFIYGPKPQPPKSAVSGTVSDNRITVEVTDGGKSMSFNVTVSLPSTGQPPYPAVIAYGTNGFSSQLSSLGIASITYNVGDVGVESGSGTTNKTGGFYSLYGATHEAGMLVAWAWGVSRILDVLEQDPSLIDPYRVGVTGCSRWGKGAFVAGVLDNRVALTIPVESGVGGTPALRLIGDLDSGGEWPYHAISYVTWFSAYRLGQFATANSASGDTTDKLPVDMHEFMALIAPRGLYIVDNPSTNYAGLDRNAAWVTANVGKKIFEALGVPDHITLQGASGGHCQWRSQYTEPLIANLRKFLLGDDSTTTGTFDTDFNGPDPESHYDWTAPTLSGEL